MSQSSNTESRFPEYAVRREIISGYFHPPLPSSTFHDLVNKGKIVPVKGLKGFYRLNDSLKRMGLREVAQLPSHKTDRSAEGILRLAFSLIDPDTFPTPAWLLNESPQDSKDFDHARLVAEVHRESILDLPSFQERAAYAAGVLDAQFMMDHGTE